MLLSEQTARLVDVPLRDLGPDRLKDIALAERIYQLGDASFPPWPWSCTTGLPAPATPLIGREREVAELVALVPDSGAAVVTLAGPGGVGKTRLALEGLGLALLPSARPAVARRRRRSASCAGRGARPLPRESQRLR